MKPSCSTISNDTSFIGDSRRIRQVVDNLFNNALRFTPDNGQIEIAVSVRDNRTIYLSITDSGPGIQIEEAECIFEAFRQSHGACSQRSGTGLGLAIARGLVRQMNGEIFLDTSARAATQLQGARFVVHFSLASSEPPEEIISNSGVVLQNRRVLVVDDMLENRLFLGQLASKWGMSPQLCSSGDEALLYLTKMHEQYDIAWLDVHMNSGMSGAELAQSIRRLLDNSLPLISLSSIGSDFTQHDLFDVSLEKPIVETLLLKHTLTLVKKYAPLTTSSSSTTTMRTKSAPAVSANRRPPLSILIADDDDMGRHVIVDVLKSYSSSIPVEHIKVVENGDQVLACLLKQNSHAYDLVILDVMMPIIDGVECIRRLKHSSLTPLPAIVMLTANVSEHLRSDCIELGVYDFLTKPIDMAALFTLVKQIYTGGSCSCS